MQGRCYCGPAQSLVDGEKPWYNEASLQSGDHCLQFAYLTIQFPGHPRSCVIADAGKGAFLFEHAKSSLAQPENATASRPCASTECVAEHCDSISCFRSVNELSDLCAGHGGQVSKEKHYPWQSQR